MTNLLGASAISLTKREDPRLVAATGLCFEQLKNISTKFHLKDVLDSHRGGIWGEEAIPGNGHPVLRSTNMRGSFVDVVDAAWRSIPLAQVEACELQTGDILVTKSSGSSDLVGKSALFIDPKDSNTYLFSNFTLRLRPNQSKVLPEFLAWFLRSPQSLMWRYEAQQTTVGLRNLKTKEFLSQIISVPDLEIQKSIVAYFNAIEARDSLAMKIDLPPLFDEQRRLVARIEELAAKIEEAQKLRRQAAEEAENFYESALASFMKLHDSTWRHGTVADVIISMDAGWSPQCGDRPAIDGEWGVLKTTSVQSCCFHPHENKVLPLTLKPRPELCVQVGDVLVTRAGPLKRVGVAATVRDAPPNLMISDKLIRLRPDVSKIESQFLEKILSSPLSQKHLVKRKTGLADAQVNISQKILRSTPIAYPSIDEQRRIVARLDELQAQVDGLKKHQVRTAEELDALLPSVLDRAFRGQL